MRHTLLLALTVTAALGAVQAPHAQTRPPVYIVNEIDVRDQAGFAAYAKRQGALIEKFGGHFLARGGQAETISGVPLRQRTVIYMFETMDQVWAWRHAPEQQELTALRDKASDFRSFLVEGCADCLPPATH